MVEAQQQLVQLRWHAEKLNAVEPQLANAVEPQMANAVEPHLANAVEPQLSSTQLHEAP